MSKAIGLMLTVAGLVLAVWFARLLWAPGPAPLSSFIVAAMAVAMISVGLRYVLKSRSKTPKDGPPIDGRPKDGRAKTGLVGDKRS